MKNHADTLEAKAVRSRRRALRRAQAIDVLAERARLIAFWRHCAETNSAYRPHNGAWWHSFAWHPSFRRLLMPDLRARLDARDKARSDQYNTELRDSARQWAQKKAERAAAKARAKLPQLDLVDDMGGST